jgi:hypothetical protein
MLAKRRNKKEAGESFIFTPGSNHISSETWETQEDQAKNDFFG